MSARDELFQLILGRTTTKAVERILAAGYRKPGVIEPEHMRIENGYLVAEVKGCTCAGGGPECNYAHENGCGLEPLADITEALERSGYSKPRTISTIEEVDALPKKAVVMTAFGDALTIYRSPRIPVEHYHFLVADGLTATVLHEGPEDA